MLSNILSIFYKKLNTLKIELTRQKADQKYPTVAYLLLLTVLLLWNASVYRYHEHVLCWGRYPKLTTDMA